MRSARRVRNRKRKETPAPVIASSEDLLTELLLRLPIKSLLKFKCVCKQWLSLITHPHFRRRKYLRSNAISALFFSTYSIHNCKFVPLDGSQYGRDLNFADCPLALKIVQSCNGFWLCGRGFLGHKYFVFNPTTKQLKALPRIRVDKRVLGVNLAFDPSKSQSYKVVCVHGHKHSRNGCRILIYSSSSKTGHWRASGGQFTAHRAIMFDKGATYWNGAIHWVAWNSTSLYFDVNEELLKEMTMPPSHTGAPRSIVPYFGESGGHLHLVDFHNDITTQFIAYEMERDRSGWFVKFVVDFNWLARFDPPSHPQRYLIGSFKQPPLNVLCVVRGEKEEDSFLVLHSNETKEVIRYNFVEQTHEKIGHIRSNLLYGWLTTFQYIESPYLL